ncbi:alpha/beta hydrolase [Streptomyces sp. NBC_01387]|uniref:alpha/beta fold hydrolase n=1 Tax=unclassified Streptomyces TaxID=2593676 RepID=UPI00202505C0|nr:MULTISPECIES: alpha/beta hydrolase [unclassified Streptomyces]MCX4551781.1 alpha/beta hydrolase [Streptomyces sp. NBC_01500]WSV57059.1 alpha/beta hydrolase [Streptomyces sp. NBC_01014]
MTAEAVRTDDGARLWAVRRGAGPPVVLCHGGPGLWDTLDEVAELLPDYAVHRWDQRGCGRSEPSDGPYTVARSVQDLDDVRRHFGLARMALLGHSWGAQLALSYALEHPGRVSGLVYVSGTGIDPEAGWHPEFVHGLHRGLGEDLERWRTLTGRDRAVLQWSVEFQDRDRARELAETMATPWYGVNETANDTINAENRQSWGTPALRVRCAELDVPVLIVDGDRDIRPRSAVDSLERALPRVERVTLRGAGHLPWAEEPAGFGFAVTAFLRRHGPATAGP